MNVCVPPSQISYVEALTPQYGIFEDWVFKEVIKVKWDHKVGAFVMELVSL